MRQPSVARFAAAVVGPFLVAVAAMAVAPAAAAPAPAASAAMPAAKPAAPPPAPGQSVGFERPTLANPGLYALGIIKVALLLVLAGAVFYVANWTYLDVRLVNTNRPLWDGVVLSGGLAGVAAATLVPVFYVGLPLGIVLFVGAAVAYATHRNALVTPPLRVLTGAHLKRIRRRLTGRKPDEAEFGPVTAAGRDIVFVGLDDLPICPETGSEADREAAREVERVLRDAIIRRASTVGYLARPGKGEVRYRISGDTVAAKDVDPPAADRFVAAVKRLAGLDLNETRKPQEGRIRAIVASLPYELRIKTAGTVKGEQVAVRIIDVTTSQMRLDQLGLSEGQQALLKEALGVRPGLVILSGPQDSGLTTTMHACLRHFDRYINNVIVFEPHIDIEVENVQHVVANQEDGPIATAEVRSRLRMEPDVIGFDSLYLAEIAQALAEAAREHTVLVGLRADDAGQAISRLTALLGSPPEAGLPRAGAAPLAERLQAVVNQRLVRLLCPECREAYRPNPEFLRRANLGAARVDVLYRPPTRGTDPQGKPVLCPRCRNDRYIGRTGLFELMPIDAAARDMIGQGATIADVRAYVRKSGMGNLQEEGLQLILEGRTSVEEVLRAIRQGA